MNNIPSRTSWRSLSRTVATAALALLVAGCADQGFPPNRPTQVAKYQAETVAGWPFEGLAEVRAYRMNWSDMGGDAPLVSDDGTLNTTRLPKEGVPLTDAEVVRLREAVCGTHPWSPLASCFWPHHAFLFLDDEGKVLGSINVCFICSNRSYNPAGFAEHWDMAAIADLVEDIGIPLSNSSWAIH